MSTSTDGGENLNNAGQEEEKDLSAQLGLFFTHKPNPAKNTIETSQLPDGDVLSSATTVDVILGDCLEFLRTLSDDSVDMVLTDPPYGIGFDGGKGWDTQWGDEAAYLNWCKQWTDECVRVLKPGRMLIVWGTLKTDTFLRYKLNILNSYPQMFGQTEIVWSYNWGGRTKTNFARKHEYAWCYSKGAEFLFNADDVRIERKVAKNLRTGEAYEKGTIPTAVWEKNNHTTSKEFCGWHPTTKNLDILDRMIRAYTNAGDTVCDPFSGSGSTAISAGRCGRNFVGCEKDPDYHVRSLQRITEALNIVPRHNLEA